MKRLVLSLMVVLLVGLLAACGGEAAEPAVPTTDTTSQDVLATPTLSPDVATLPPAVVTGGDGATTGGGETAVTEPPAPESAVPVPIVPWPTDRFGYGVQIHGNASVGNPADTMHAVRDQLGLQWVKMQLKWPVIHPSPEADQWFFYDAVIEESNKYGLNLMISIVGAPTWTRALGGENGPPDDYAQYTAFLNELLDRHPGRVQAIEVWNEQNLDREWTTTNGISPEDYVTFLRQAYETIKAKDPNIIVISGALSPTGPGDWVRWADDFEYLDRALAAGMLSYADCVGVHHNGYNLPPDVTAEAAPAHPQGETAVFRGPFDNPHHSWSFKTTVDTYAQKVQAVDPNMKLCVTEFGWASSEGYDVYPTGFEFAQDNTLQEQSDFIVQAFTQMYDSGDVWLAFLFNFDFGNKGSGPTDDPTPYSILDVNGAPRPAYSAVSTMEKTP
jgi:polysaccharide biosynthesis protein PslG